MSEKGESGVTFYGIRSYIEKYRPPLIILENVKNAPWKIVADKYNEIGYHVVFDTGIDTKTYYLPQTRERGYALCIDKNRMAEQDIMQKGSLKSKWSVVFEKFKRPASSPASMFILDEDDQRLLHIQKDMAIKNANGVTRLINWSRYQARHQSYRLDNKLGYKRPMTRFQDNGTCKMPDFVWQEWSKCQPERIWDTLDMNFLRTLDKGYDLNFKE